MDTKNWTIEDIPDLKGKIIIVTGGNSGLGLASVKAFASKNAEVIMACRSVQKGEQARKAILVENPKANIRVMELDLSNFWSIRIFVGEIKKSYRKLDILLNNAGIMMPPYSKTKDGIELQQSTNYFGHYALTGLLLDLLAATSGSRVVNVSSLAHKSGKMNFNNLLYEKGKGYSPYKAYSRSKLENLIFTFELQRFFKSNNIDCKAVVAHPGVSDTNLFTNIVSGWVNKLFRPLFVKFVQPAAMGALPQLRAAVDANVKGAEFYGPNGFMQMKGYPVRVKAASHAYNIDSARQLWKYSEKVTGVVFEPVKAEKRLETEQLSISKKKAI